jgi:hypothetical protein
MSADFGEDLGGSNASEVLAEAADTTCFHP